ncbi:MAG: beta-N-acetylhexosaminidase [Clostridia bacterium]|nr:beta-N-acetylhexosaminidase [Clostridia bacterium]
MKLHFINLADDLLSAIAELQEIAGFTLADDGFPVTVEPGEEGLSVTFTATGATVRYHKPVELFRALSRLVENYDSREDVSEIPAYEDLCVMYDLARNGVFTVDTCKRTIRHLALMGYTSVQLYLEDCYEVDGYPYFGYLRGRYTKAELKEIARYGDRFGVEVVPSIQVLAHMRGVTRWAAFSKVRDCNDILLVDEPETYKLIDAMFTTLEECFTTRQVHVGMDEAWMLGCGQYYNKHGHVEWVDIMESHMHKVVEICRKHGFKPMMWSDMFFGTAFDRNGYYYATTLDDPHMPKAVIDSVPAEMELVYWDYGNYYDKASIMMRLHNEFNNPIWFAGGATKWCGMAPFNRYSIDCSRSQLRACRDNGIKKVMVTVWASGGATCANMTVLPTIQMYAEDCYAGNTEDARLAGRFATCVGASYEDFLMLDDLNLVPGNEFPGGWWCNLPYMLFFQDVLVGLFEKHVDPATFPAHFADVAARLRAAADRNPQWRYMFDAMAGYSAVLEYKATVGAELIAAYKAGDKATMEKIVRYKLPAILERLEAFIPLYHTQWLAENKVFGLDAIDIRYGALKHRLQVAIDRIGAYLNGTVDSLPELEEERLSYNGKQTEGIDVKLNEENWIHAWTASVVVWNWS